MTPSEACYALIRESEGLRLTAYADAGHFAIGYGHTLRPGEHPKAITKAQAEALMRADAKAACFHVEQLVHVALSQNEVDALTDFVFNLGAANFARSTLLRLVNAGHFTEAANQFHFWVYSGGVVLPGLVKRRAAEQKMFLNSEGKP